MADDQLAQLMAQQSLLQSSQGAGGKGAPILAGILPGGGRDIDVGGGLSLKGKGFNSDSMLNKLPQGKTGTFKKLLDEMGLNGKAIVDGMQKVAQAGPVKEASISDIMGSNNAPQGGFAANLGRGGDGGNAIG